MDQAVSESERQQALRWATTLDASLSVIHPAQALVYLITTARC